MSEAEMESNDDVNAMQTSNPYPTTVAPPPPLPPSGDEPRPNDDHEFLKSNIPVGWRFQPTPEEIILTYLTKKINNEVLPPCLIHAVELYAFTPDQLSEKFRPSGKNEWYFFTPRDKKYKKGTRPRRTAGNGYWKPQKKEHVMHNGEIIGESRNCTYHKGAPTKGVRTAWLMCEFRGNFSSTTQDNTMRLDDWVVCKLYKKQKSLLDGSGSTGDKNKNAKIKRPRLNKKVKDGEANCSGSTGDENENAKIKRPRLNKRVKDGEANNSESTPLSMKSSSNATSGKSPSSVDVSLITVDAALIPYPCNMSRLGISFDPAQNIAGSLSNAINGEGTNMAAMKLHGASSHPIPVASSSSLVIEQSSLTSHHHHQQVPSFAFVIEQSSLTSHHHHQHVPSFAFESTNVMKTPSGPFDQVIKETDQNCLDSFDEFIDVDEFFGSGSDNPYFGAL